MEKVYALMIGETVIEKSANRNELVLKRGQMPVKNGKEPYIVIWIGRIELNKQPDHILATLFEETN